MHSKIKLTPLLDTIQFIEMSDEEYFSPKWSGYISNSKLALINPDQDGSPSKYKEGLTANGKYSDSLVFGSAVHEMVLQPDEFTIVKGIDRPTAKMGAMADELYKHYSKPPHCVTEEQIIEASNKIDYYKGKMDATKCQNVLSKCEEYWKDRFEWERDYGKTSKSPIYLDPKSREKLYTCVRTVSEHKEIQSLLHPEGLFETPISMNEAALFMDVKAELDDKDCILKLKGKLDNFTIDTETEEVVLNDLKTTGHWLCNFGDSFVKYHYSRQMAMYVWILRQYVISTYKFKPSKLTANMLLVSTVPDYSAGVFRVANDDIKEGFKEFSDLLRRVAYLEIYGDISDGALGTQL